MATQIQRRGGSTTDHEQFVGAERELTIDTTKQTVIVHDGQTQGGHPLAREDLSNVSEQTIANKGFARTEHVPPCGAVMPYAFQMAPVGWLLLNGATIGPLGSGADYMGEEYKALFKGLWENWADEYAPVLGGRGVNSEDDWLAKKALKLPDTRGRSLIGAGQGTNLTNRPIGSKGGEETHTLIQAESPEHFHYLVGGGYDGVNLASGHNRSIAYSRSVGQGGLVNENFEYTLGSNSQEAYMGKSNKIGGSQPHNNMPPWLAFNWIIKI